MNELKTVEFGSGVKKIGMAAFKRCEKLSDIPGQLGFLKALPDLCQSLFQEPDFKRLKDSDQTEVLRQVRYRFSANVNQVARVCGISYAEAARMLDGE